MGRLGRDGEEFGVLEPLVWFAGSLAVVALALWVIGIEAVLETLSRTDPRDVAGVLGLAAVTVLARGVSLGVVFAVMGASVSTLRASALYVASTFLNDVTPSGQAGGAPASGLLIAYTGDAKYEIGLAAVLVVNVLANLVMLAAGLLGVGYLTVTIGTVGGETGAGTTPDFGVLAATTLGLLALIVLAVAALWRYRSTATTVLVEALVRAAQLLDRVLRRFDAPDRPAVTARVERFWNSLDRLGRATPRQAAVVLVSLTVAHAASIAALWVAFRAVGDPVAFAFLLAVVPTAVVAAIAPVPGGAGGTEVALIALLISLTPLDAATVGAAVVLYRAGTHWLRTLLGGLLTAGFVAFGRAEDR